MIAPLKYFYKHVSFRHQMSLAENYSQWRIVSSTCYLLTRIFAVSGCSLQWMRGHPLLWQKSWRADQTTLTEENHFLIKYEVSTRIITVVRLSSGRQRLAAMSTIRIKRCGAGGAHVTQLSSISDKVSPPDLFGVLSDVWCGIYLYSLACAQYACLNFNFATEVTGRTINDHAASSW